MHDRVTRLEEKIMELEHSLTQLNDVIIDQFRAIEKLQIANQQLQNRFDSLNESRIPDEQDERPPHY
ncbi:MAG TPA: hypothetical protein DD979_08830 [Gammaproteobacteria bacterium]|jgi:uncharacterized coiled-coil protein SlyX|nr:hypothetical protein [Gammaproteobacteria bacterium]